MAQNRTCSKQTARSVDDRCTVERSKPHEYAGLQIRDRPAFQQMKKVPARWPFRSTVSFVELPDRQIEAISGRNQLRYRSVGLANDDEYRAFAGIGQIASGLEHPGGQRLVADGVCPKSIFRLRIHQMPGRPAEREHFGAFGKDHNLPRRAEHRADVPVLGGRPRMRLKRPGSERILAGTARPSPDVDDVEQPPLGAGQKQGVDPLGEPEEALDTCQGFVIRRDDGRGRNARPDGIGARAQQHHPC